MLVTNMSLPEIKKAVIDDYNREIKGKISYIRIAYTGKWIRNGRKNFAETIAFPVQSRNTWRMTVTGNSNGITVIPFLIFYNNTGITASYLTIDFEPLQLMHFNAHFFKRYRERAKIAIDKPEQLVSHFFRRNPVLLPGYYPRNNGTQQLITPLTTGLGLGNYHLESEICEFKTFVDNSLLTQDQVEQVQQIWVDTVTLLTADMTKCVKTKETSSAAVCA